MKYVWTSLAALAATSSVGLAQFGTNLVANGDFEAGSVFLGLPNDWTTINNPNGEWTDAFNRTPGGSRSVSIPVDGGFDAWGPSTGLRPLFVPIPPDSNGGPITFSYWYNMPQQVEASVAGAKIDWFNESGTRLGTTGDLDLPDRITTGWVEATYEFTAPAGATRAGILLFVFSPDNAPGSGTVYYDDVSLVQAQGVGACNSADIAEPFGVLDSADVAAFLDRADADATLFAPDENRVGNPSVEDNFVDPANGLVPTNWFSFNFDPDGNFYKMSGQDGAPVARTGDYMLRVADDGTPGGFHGWTADGFATAPFNLEKPLTLSGYFNVPSGISASVVGVKLESINIDDDGNFAGFVGPVTLQGGPGSGDVLISNGSPTDGWEFFSITYPADRLSPNANRVRPLVFLFQGGGVPITGDIYFDDISITQEDVLRADFNEDGQSDFFDILDFLKAIDAGCPGG